MKIQKVTDPSFAPYGKVLEGYDFAPLLKAMAHTPLPMDGVVYEPSAEELEAVEAAEELKTRGFGGIPIQVGYCNGNNDQLNALEYHRSSEFDIAVDDLVLLVGKQQDIEKDFTYDTAKVEGFLLPGGMGVELYGTTLHYAPCSAGEDGFRCVIVLPKGTNTEFSLETRKTGEDRLLTARNKWLIACEEAGIEGAFCGLNRNIQV